MKNYLYILPFKDKLHFKLGVSSNNYNRIKVHNNTYGIDLSKSIIVESSSRNIRTLERLLLILCKEIDSNPFVGKDGYTEIRSISYLGDCIRDLNEYKDRLGLTIRKCPKSITSKQEIKNSNKINLIKESSNIHDSINQMCAATNKLINLLDGNYTINSMGHNTLSLSIKDGAKFQSSKFMNDRANYGTTINSSSISIGFGAISYSYTKESTIFRFGIYFPYENKSDMILDKFNEDIINKYFECKKKFFNKVHDTWEAAYYQQIK